LILACVAVLSFKYSEDVSTQGWGTPIAVLIFWISFMSFSISWASLLAYAFIRWSPPH
jgi:hypothetical protein